MKKIWVFGKVYDLFSMPLQDIKKDIEARVKDFVNVDIPVTIDVNNKYVGIAFHRGLNEKLCVGTYLEYDTWLLTGEGYNGFVPVYSFGSIAHFPNMLYYIDENDFLKSYKKNFDYYCNTKIKKVSVYEGATILSATIKY